jgi:leucyl aminopeptidase (aminopeptidase T)
MKIDQELREGARNAIQTCMNVSQSDRVYIISDEETLVVGQALKEESIAIGATTELIKLEDFGPRPIQDMPENFMENLQAFDPTVTFYAASAQEGELSFRMKMGAQRAQQTPKIRHGHMISITTQVMREGMRADYNKIHDLTMRVYEMVQKAKTITFTSNKGSKVSARFSPGLKWVPCHGLYHKPGEWGNLPEGEVYTCPASVDGTIVADMLGDYFSPKYGVLKNPVTFEVEAGWVKNIACDDKGIEKELWNYLTSNENGRRAGEFAIGTNTALTKLSGVLLQDEKIPGIHIAFGNPLPRQTGADWTASTHIDVIPTDCTITLDDTVIMRDGKFTFE